MFLDLVAVGILALVMLICTIAVCVEGLIELTDHAKKAGASPRSML